MADGWGQYSVEHLEASRAKGFANPALLGKVYEAFLPVAGPVRVLDAACGTGFFTRVLAGIRGAHVTGMDIDPALLAAAEELARQAGLPIRFVQGDMRRLPFEDGAFDVVTSHIVLEVFDDKAAVLREMQRVCRSGGWVCTMEPVYTAYTTWVPGLTDAENRALNLYMTAGRSMGAAVEVPDAMHRIGLAEVETIGWFWGGAVRNGWRNARRLDAMKREADQGFADALTADERVLLTAALDRLEERSDQALPDDLGISGMPVLITKGRVI